MCRNELWDLVVRQVAETAMQEKQVPAEELHLFQPVTC